MGSGHESRGKLDWVLIVEALKCWLKTYHKYHCVFSLGVQRKGTHHDGTISVLDNTSAMNALSTSIEGSTLLHSLVPRPHPLTRKRVW